MTAALDLEACPPAPPVTHAPATHATGTVVPTQFGRIRVRPAPSREPLFDDELPADLPEVGHRDQRLPFETPGPQALVWRPVVARPRGLPDPEPWGRRLVVGLIETAGGRRPLQQVSALLSPAVARGLGADFDRANAAGRRHWLHRATVRSVRVGEPGDGVAELCATVDTGPRVRALAMRLEEQHGRWRCTRLQLG